MPLMFGVKRLDKLDDWISVVGEKNWVPKHSGYELAHNWHGRRGFPASLAKALEDSKVEALAELRPEVCYVEKPVLLDTGRAPSMTDIMVYSKNAAGDPVVIGVEGKALEPFAARVFSWTRGDKELRGPEGPTRASRVRRLEFLARHLGITPDPDSPLRYQLIHRTTSVVLEATLYGAAAGVVVIQSFCEEGDNGADFSAFLAALGLSAPQKNRLTPHVQLGLERDVPLFFLWLSESCHEQAA